MNHQTKFKQTEIGMIPEDWKVKEFGDFIKVQNGFAFKSSDFKAKGIPIIKIKNITSPTITFEEVQYYNEDIDDKLKPFILQKGDVIISMTGSNVNQMASAVGKVARYKSDLPALLNQRAGKIIIDSNIADSDYIYFYIARKEIQYYLAINAAGSANQANISPDTIKSIPIALPPLSEQRVIAKILYDLDEKIELNQRMNKTLEAIGQAIFKHWFVNFEFPDKNGKPYKSNGGEMVDCELGPIPKEWEIANFNAFVNEIFNGDWGKASALDNYEKKVYCMRGADIPKIYEGKKGKMPIRYILEKNLNKKVLCAGDLVIEISGGSPTQSTGRVTYINQEILSRFDTKLICSNFCKVIKLINKDYCEYLFLYLKYLYELNIFFNFENGTTGIKNLDIKNLFEKYKIKVPDELIILKFRKIIEGLFRKIQENGYKNNKLSSLRDILLLKLISGEIRVPINNKEGDE